ncbi:MAG TPA: DHHA1 domain-containing protein [Anaerolineae bacterium]|nr:DHHA1 domain-containing protein [Anaerolineae bacterium]
MMTLRLYYDDPTRCEFAARVCAWRDTERGPAVRLDQTAFYPTSGGQPHDTGLLNMTPVLEVWEDDAGDIWHLVAQQFEAETVVGQIDWARRFDHMQQHTGQHLLSAVCAEEWDAATVGFHLGATASTVDLDMGARSPLTWEDVARMEAHVNRIIFENRPVTIHNVSPDALGAIPLRKPPAVTGIIRVIWVADCDASACGGTHVQHTGEVGLLKVTSLERYKGGARVTFLCGGRALADYARALGVLRTVGGALSVGQDDIPAAVARLQEDSKLTHRALQEAHSALYQYEAARLWEETPEIADHRCIAAYWADRDFAAARAIASELRARPRTILLLAVAEEKGVRLLCARSDDLPTVDAAALLRALTDRLGGRGGGSATLAQGGVPSLPSETVLTALQEVVAHLSDTPVEAV